MMIDYNHHLTNCDRFPSQFEIKRDILALFLRNISAESVARAAPESACRRDSHSTAAHLDTAFGQSLQGLGVGFAFGGEDPRGKRIGVSSSWTGTVRCRMIGPWSYWSSAKWTVQPVTLTP